METNNQYAYVDAQDEVPLSCYESVEAPVYVEEEVPVSCYESDSEYEGTDNE